MRQERTETPGRADKLIGHSSTPGSKSTLRTRPDMKITCQSCQSKYTVSDEKVQGKTVKIKCRKCGATILVNSSGATTTNASDPAAAAAEATTEGGTYQVNVAEGDQRSMSLQEVVQAYNSSVITADTYVWADGMGDWQPLGQVQAIVDALNAAAAGGAGAPEAAAPEPARAAVKKDGGRGGARDLFGAEAQSDVSTSAPVFSAPKAPPPPRIGAGKEEQSALFSLSALTSRAGTSGSSSAAGSLASLSAMSSASAPVRAQNNEDSGLIELKALAAGAAAAPAPSAAASLLGDTGGLFQLAPPPMTATAAPMVTTPEEVKPQKNRTPLFIGIGAVVAIGAIVGAFMVMKGGPPPEQPTTNTAAPANTPPPLETAPPSPTPTVAATPTPDSTGAVAKGGGTTKTGGGTKSGSGTTTKTGTAPTTGGGTAPTATTPPVKKSGGCGCAAGDLMCAMRCSAKGK